jgi:glycosyltransferase involved in cell wall biosynthesis
MPRIAAIICARNEELHIESSLRCFAAEGIDVVLLDHASTDGTRAIAEGFLGKGLLRIVDLPWQGTFSLLQQLRAKAEVAEGLDHNWIVHADADEWLQPAPRFASLREGIASADAGGYNAINFEEFVFVARDDESFEGRPYRELMRRYYFFAPRPHRLHRAWRARSGLTNIAGGGHHLSSGKVQLFPENFILRHYITLSRSQVVSKYAGRCFSQEELRRGWHANRKMPAARLTLTQPWRLKILEAAQSRDFDRTEPQTLHYWEWDG